MANTTSPNMGLIVPGVGTELGPAWATDLNNDLTVLDGHNHTLGSGVQIPTAGLNINADLSINTFNLIGARSVRWLPQSGILTGPLDLACAYVNGVDLYYNDANGNAVRITQNGGVTGAPGNISGLTPPASASYNAINKTFVFQSGVNIPASLDGGSVILRNLSLNSNGVTLSPPASLPSNYTLTMPAIPAQQTFLTIDTSGNISAPWTLDPNYLTIIGNLITFSTLGQQSLVPSGFISAFGGTAAPAGYLLCDGTSYLRAAFPTLFATIGTAYGSADSTHFNVPDLRGMFTRGVTGTTGNDPDASSRTALNPGGNTGNAVGSAQGFALQQHVHLMPFANDEAASNVPSDTAVSQVGPQEYTYGVTGATVSNNETRPINVYVNYVIKT
jgi:microcystin-dependent protein